VPLRERSTCDPAAAMTEADLQRWLDAYVDAWRTYDTGAIAALFSEDARYRYRPYQEPLAGRDAIAASWLEDRDEPDSWDAEYRPLLVHGDRAIAVGETRYRTGDVYSNLWVMRFDDRQRCADFVEWFMKHP
jgi:ketosteroid isomerase-like protein